MTPAELLADYAALAKGVKRLGQVSAAAGSAGKHAQVHSDL